MQVCRRGPPFGSAVEIEAELVTLGAARAILKCLYATPNTKGAVMHVGAVGEIPDFLPRPAMQASASVSIVAARQQPGLRDQPAQVGLQSSESPAHWHPVSARHRRKAGRQCAPEVGGGVKATFSLRRNISNPPNCRAIRA